MDGDGYRGKDTRPHTGPVIKITSFFYCRFVVTKEWVRVSRILMGYWLTHAKSWRNNFFLTRSTAGVFNVRIAQKFTVRTRTGIF
jgi:hypothetical protein